MLRLSDEIYRRFPELQDGIAAPEPDPSYDVMSQLVRWLASQGAPDSSPTLVRRVVDFHDWCTDQPLGSAASDDIYTILVASFYEKLIQNRDTRAWITHLFPQEELLDNREYLVSWIGREAFDLAVASYAVDAPARTLHGTPTRQTGDNDFGSAPCRSA